MGGPGKPPFWRTLREFCNGLGPVTLKINTQHTLDREFASSGNKLSRIRDRHYRYKGYGLSLTLSNCECEYFKFVPLCF